MQKFDCLSIDCPLLGAHILEASAGTGKTFSIEHVFVRLLLEKKGIELEEILAVTFTRAAARELKGRIRNNIEKAISFLQNGLSPWDYLKAVDHPERAIRILLDAQAVFDRCQIFTIHGFCYRMLKEFAFEANLGFSTVHPDKRGRVPKKLLKKGYQFIEKEIPSDLLSTEQMGIILKKYDSVEAIVASLFIKSEGDYFPFSDVWNLYSRALFSWEGPSIEPEKLLEDFRKIAPNYKAAVKGNFEDQVAFLASNPEDPLFLRKLLREKGSLFDFLDPSNRKVKCSEISFLHYPSFFPWAREKIAPIVQKAMNPRDILFTLRSEWERVAAPVLAEEEWLHPDEILNQMGRAIKNENFVSRIQKKYKAVIVDEFQDTDPIQWDIFRSLFLESKEPLQAVYLVGDPKQSIYRFRKADVYTYFKAREFLGEEALYRLDTNFRSSKELIYALNALFSHNWLSLPKLQKHIASPPLLAGFDPISPFQDEKKHIHFIMGDGSNSLFEDTFLPFAISEMEKLFSIHPSWSSYAILVKDRHQAKMALDLCQARSIPAMAKDHIPLGKTFAFQSLMELLKAAAFPKDLAVQRIVQSGPFSLFPLSEARNLLEEKGLASFFHQMSFDSFDGDFRQDLRQLIEELLAWEGKEGFSLEGLFRFLNEFELLDAETGGRRRIEGDLHAVQILTLHISKGLEFDVVFALGLISRTPESEDAEEFDAEKLRQLYVAMTRAKLRLYVPVLFSEKKGAIGSMAPIELFVETLEKERGPFLPFLQKVAEKESISFERVSSPFPLSPLQNRSTPQETISSHPNIPYFESSLLLSFTSLAENHGEFHLRDESSSSDTLPKGKETGIIIHQILENLFSSPRPLWRDPAALETLVAREVDFSPLAPWKESIHKMIWNTLIKPLHTDGTTFTLLDLEPENVQTEIEFLFSSPPHFMKGFIDLVFYLKGKYYIVDWKTNWLGPAQSSYKSLDQAMDAHDYWLQAALYTEALQRHVKQFDMRPFEEIFGGAIYFFIRGPAFCHFMPDLNLIERAMHGR